jgi:hypothetical protein
LAIILPGEFSEQLVGSHSSIEQDDTIAEVHDQDVLLQHAFVERQEIVRQLAVDFVLCDVPERCSWCAQRELAVRYDRAFGLAKVEIEVRRLRQPQHQLGVCLGRQGESRSRSRRGRQERAAGDRQSVLF